jgi:large subunit ribosomal protein L20
MARVKGGPKSSKRRRNILKRAKGYRHGRSTKKRAAKDALVHAGKYAFRDRRAKKRTMRALHTVKINAAVREAGFKSYSTFISALKKQNVVLDRKVLSELAEFHPEAFLRLLKKVSPPKTTSA